MKGTSEKWSGFLRNVRKKSGVEMSLCLFLLVSIAACYCVDVLHILPRMYRQLCFKYLIHVLPLTFIVFNALANFLAVVFIDSSVVGRLRTVSEYPMKGNSIVFCNTCQCDVPLRSWHCDVCDVCILTRDHHCTFSTTCVGHYNKRYFMWFLLYLSVASFYQIVLISYYTYCNVTVQFLDLLVLIPIKIIISGFHLTVGQIFIVLLTFNLVTGTMSTFLLIYHFEKLRIGLVNRKTYEKNYNFGLIQNLAIVFGEKWFMTWISPFIQSKLPNDGLNWQIHVDQFKTE